MDESFLAVDSARGNEHWNSEADGEEVDEGGWTKL